jgi:chorismate synthase
MEKMITFNSAGESHGRGVLALLSGVPAGFTVTAQAIDNDLARRQKGYGRGGRMSVETDRVQIISGVRGKMTLGTPIALLVENRDYRNWERFMDSNSIEPGKEVIRPRPGHADLAGGMKYDHRDMRNVLERASARETAARVAAGSLLKSLLAPFEIQFFGYVLSIGGVHVDYGSISIEERARNAETSPFSTPVHDKDEELKEIVDSSKADGDTLGGTVEVVVTGLPTGLGSYEQWDSRLDGQIAGAVMSIPAIKGVEIGDGFKLADVPGSRAHDEIFHKKGKGYLRNTNRAGGMEGGITNGESLVVRAAMKPIPTLMKPLASVDLSTKESVSAAAERSDVCAVPAAAVVVEAMVSLIITRSFFNKFGGDCRRDVEASYEAYRERLRNW